MKINYILSAIAALVVCLLPFESQAQSTAFTYQGRLNEGANPANGKYDLRFVLYGGATGGTVISGPRTNALTDVTNGLFGVTLDFGASAFTGPNRWLQIDVRTNGNGAFVPLDPRQQITPTPYAIFASAAGTVSGAISNAQIASGQVVKNLNGLKDSVTLAAGSNLSLATNGNILTLSSTGTGAFSTIGTNAYYIDGNVSIGRLPTSNRLDIAGDIGLSGILKLGGNRTILAGFDGASNHWFGASPDTDLAFGLNRKGANNYDLTLNGNLGYRNLTKLDVADNFTATVRAGDFLLGHPTRHGVPGRALVDLADALQLNFANDWPKTILGGKVGIGTGDPQSALDVNGTVTATEFSGSGARLTAISGNSIAPGTIGSTQLAPSSVGSNQVAPGAITTDALSNGAVTATKIAVTSNWFSSLILNPTPAQGDSFGSAVAAVGPDRVLIGAPSDDSTVVNAGAAYLLKAGGTPLMNFANPTPAAGDSFGRSVAALGTDRVVIGAPGDYSSGTDRGAAYLFGIDGTFLTTFLNPLPSEIRRLGNSVAAVGGDKLLIAGLGTDTAGTSYGAAFLFDTNGNTLASFNSPALSSFDGFGSSVAGLSNGRILFGAPGDDTTATDSGAAYLFDLNHSSVAIQNPSPAAGDSFGYAVATLGQDRLVIGAPGDDGRGIDAGIAYLFGTNGSFLATFNNPAPAANDNFGRSVSGLGNDRVVIGALKHVGGLNAGAVYVFSTNGSLLTTFSDPKPFAQGFSVKNISASALANNCHVDTAEAILASPSQQGAVYTERASVINYDNFGGSAHFGSDIAFPGFSGNTDQNYFVIEATGVITIPSSGNWTFGVNSDDGFRCSIGGNVFSDPSLRLPTDTLVTYNLAAGDYPVRLVFFECAGGAEVEFFAASGSYSSFNSGVFRLVGDTVNGGLAVKSLPISFGSSIAGVGNNRVLIGAPDHDTGSAYLWTLQTYHPGLVSESVLAGSITTASLEDAAVNSEKIADGSIAAADVDTASFNTTFWRTSGNAGTIPGTHFIGTTDDLPLDLRVSNRRGLRLEPAYGNNVNVIGGWHENSVAPFVAGATIAGGGAGNLYGPTSSSNRVEASLGTISGGSGNTIESGALGSVIAGGEKNVIGRSAYDSTIGGGVENRIVGNGSRGTIPGGAFNVATNYAFAAGQRAKANHTGAFVWADSTDADFATTAANQFLIRASGGVGIGTTTPADLLEVAAGPRKVGLNTVVAGVNAGGVASFSNPSSGNKTLLVGVTASPNEDCVLFGSGGGTEMRLVSGGLSSLGFGFYLNMTPATAFSSTRPTPVLKIDGAGNVGIGLSTPNFRLEVNGGAHRFDNSANWNVVSDRRLKRDVISLTNSLAIMEQLRPVSFRYNEEYVREHPATTDKERVGFVAQEFQEVFPDSVNRTPDGYLSVDISPVTFHNTAAIRELNHKLNERETKIAQLEKRIEKLEELLNKAPSSR